MISLEENLQESIFDVKLPSFSIVYETENLSSVELENIYRSLASLDAQDISPAQANEFLIIDGGYAPQEVIEELCLKYPWITVKQMPGISYYEAKMLGANLVSGDIVIFCDSDCQYEPNWLNNVLTFFSQNSEINVVAGETSTPIRNFYEIALAAHYFFPRFSNREQPYKSNHYFLNAVAFRRHFLLENPIPTSLPLYRGNCLLHAFYLAKFKENPIWKHPKARAIHEPPTLSFISWRYLLKGRDRVLREYIKPRMTKNLNEVDYSQLSTEIKFTGVQKLRGIVAILWQIKPFHLEKIGEVLREKPHHLAALVLAIPLMLWFELLFTLGRIITYLQPNLLLKLYRQGEEELDELTTADSKMF